MTPPTPAAVRAAMKPVNEWSTDEQSAWRDDERPGTRLLGDHIRAVCAEMRGPIPLRCAPWTPEAIEQLLRVYADRLEGREP